jgi:hypothetical protein
MHVDVYGIMNVVIANTGANHDIMLWQSWIGMSLHHYPVYFYSPIFPNVIGFFVKP